MAEQISWPDVTDQPITLGCPACAAERRDRQRQQQARAGTLLRREKLKRLLEVASVPERFAHSAFDNYTAETDEQRRVLAICRRYAETWPRQYAKGGTLVLTGSTGTGKTHLACAIANTLIAEHMSTVVYGEVPKLMREIKETYRQGAARSEREALNQFLDPDLVIVDEIGAQKGSEHELLMLFEIVNGRYQRCKPTIMISNLNAEELDRYLGERIMDRFAEGPVLALNWTSHRRRGQP